MAEVVNLRAKRKAAMRAVVHSKGIENAAKFGRTKGQKLREAAEIARAKAALDGKKVAEDGPA